MPSMRPIHLSGEKTKSSEPLVDPARCKHEATDRRGSPKTTTRLYCEMCGTVVDEMPREEARKREAAAKNVANMKPHVFDTTAAIVEHEVNNSCMDAEAALEVWSFS